MTDKDFYQQRCALLSGLLDAIPEPILAKNEEGKFVYANKKLLQMYRTTLDELVGKEDHDFTGDHALSADYKRDALYVIKNQCVETVQESALDTTSGIIHHYESLKAPFCDAIGNKLVVVFAKDITDAISKKQQAETKEQQLEYILDVSGEGMWDWTITDNTVLHNQHWGVITGIEESEKSFEEFQNFIFEEDKSRVNEALRALLEEDKPYDIQFRATRANDGKQVWLWDRGRVVERDADGKPLRAVGLVQDITETKLNQMKIENLAFYDILTKLPNRALLQDRMIRELELCKREDCFGAVLFIDLDHFKQLNDTHGHAAGDELLIEVARRIQQNTRSLDTVSRLGGDEFIVLISNITKDETHAMIKSERIARKILEHISQPLTLQIAQGTLNYNITASIGITLFDKNTESPHELIKMADVALYNAKENGRDNCLVFDPDMESKVKYNVRIEHKLREAIRQSDFVLHYQPQFDEQRNMVAVEALVRWQHPEQGLLLPEEFISVAEETGLILPIGHWVLSEACKQLKRWQTDPSRAHLGLSVNISTKQLWQKNFVADLISMLEEAGIDHSKLKLEITESILLKDISDTTKKLHQLKAFGLHLSLDDFGTGYSSLVYLKNLPIDEIKIDRSFINDILDDDSDMMMVRSIVSLGEHFGIGVVSEGVEKAAQFESLKGLGNMLYQGYYFGQPMPAEEI